MSTPLATLSVLVFHFRRFEQVLQMELMFSKLSSLERENVQTSRGGAKSHDGSNANNDPEGDEDSSEEALELEPVAVQVRYFDPLLSLLGARA